MTKQTTIVVIGSLKVKKKINKKKKKSFYKCRLLQLWLVLKGLRELGTLGTFSAILYKGDNFCEFLFVFMQTEPILKTGFSKRRNFLPREANSLLLE